jgi:hypothetical protein
MGPPSGALNSRPSLPGPYFSRCSRCPSLPRGAGQSSGWPPSSSPRGPGGQQSPHTPYAHHQLPEDPVEVINRQGGGFTDPNPRQAHRQDHGPVPGLHRVSDSRDGLWAEVGNLPGLGRPDTETSRRVPGKVPFAYPVTQDTPKEPVASMARSRAHALAQLPCPLPNLRGLQVPHHPTPERGGNMLVPLPLSKASLASARLRAWGLFFVDGRSEKGPTSDRRRSASMAPEEPRGVVLPFQRPKPDA